MRSVPVQLDAVYRITAGSFVAWKATRPVLYLNRLTTEARTKKEPRRAFNSQHTLLVKL